MLCIAGLAWASSTAASRCMASSGHTVCAVQRCVHGYCTAFTAFTSERSAAAQRSTASCHDAGGHEYDVSGIFATNPGDAPGPGALQGADTVSLRVFRPYTVSAWGALLADMFHVAVAQ